MPAEDLLGCPLLWCLTPAHLLYIFLPERYYSLWPLAPDHLTVLESQLVFIPAAS